MRMRFCATIRKPAFSISALTAPVRLRAVASGLMIEKVRSVAMSFGPQINGEFRVAALISAHHAPGKRPYGELKGRNYSNFTMVNPIRKGRVGAVQQRSHRLQSTGSPRHFGRPASDFPTARRRRAR